MVDVVVGQDDAVHLLGCSAQLPKLAQHEAAAARPAGVDERHALAQQGKDVAADGVKLMHRRGDFHAFSECCIIPCRHRSPPSRSAM
jgi:hypothetical protein